MQKKFVLLLYLVFLYFSAYSQSKIEYNNNLIAFSIKNEKVIFENDKNRIFILISNLSCNACINETVNKINKLKTLLIDSCEIIIILQGNPVNVLECRNNINYYSNIFFNVDKYLFCFDKFENSIFQFQGHLNKDFPKLFIVPKSCENIIEVSYATFNVEKTKKMFNSRHT
ncbi:MAG: hypothetical protein LBV69_10745 [Bacteroidales bacterium]|jgi:hypothetical protein|nr:hypothetical protein [Bacteroidales bacterium]